MTRVIDLRLPAAERNVWSEEGAERLRDVLTMFEIAGVRVLVKVLDAQVDPHDSGYLLMKLRMPRET